MLPVAFIGLQEFRLAHIRLRFVEGQHCVLAWIQAPQAKVPELVASILLIKIRPVPVFCAWNIQDRGMSDGFAIAVYDCSFNGRPFALITTSKDVSALTMNPESATSRPSRYTDSVM
jgi:hypothetical protein